MYGFGFGVLRFRDLGLGFLLGLRMYGSGFGIQGLWL